MNTKIMKETLNRQVRQKVMYGKLTAKRGDVPNEMF